MAAQNLPSVSYTGDDWSQTLARTLWLPMLLMGLMAVAVGLVASIDAGVDIGDFFGGESAAALRTGTAVTTWAVATTFLGMAFILSSITMVLVNIIRTLRDTGRDVQQAVGARKVTKLRKPLTGHLTPHVMMMGLMTVIAAFVVSVVQANLISGIPPDGLANPAALQGGDLADYGTTQAWAQWLGPLRLFGLALIFVSIVLALRTIIKAITFQAQRVYELSAERAGSLAAGPADTTGPPAPGTGWQRSGSSRRT